MKISLLVGLSTIAISAICVVLYKNIKNKDDDKNRSTLLDLKKVLDDPFVKKQIVDEISFRTYGKWLQEHDFPSFTGYKFFILKTKEIYNYIFVITDAEYNVIDSSYVTGKSIDTTFANKISEEVNEIKID